MHAEEKIKQMVKVSLCGVVNNSQSFCVAWMVLVGRLLVLAARVSCFGIQYARQASKKFFHPPKTASSEDDRFCHHSPSQSSPLPA